MYTTIIVQDNIEFHNPKAMSSTNKIPRAIMISFHLQGHIIPFVNLAIKLASKGFTITFAHLEHIHHQISKSRPDKIDTDIFSKARDSGLDISYTTISDGFPVEFNRSPYYGPWLSSFQHDFPSKVDEFVANLIESDSKDYNYFLITDTFCSWPREIAEKYNLVNVSFWTEPALVFSLYYHMEILRKNGHIPVTKHEEVDYVPGIKSINTKDFMSYFHDSELTSLHKIIFQAFDTVKSADFILCNTVQELESGVISGLAKNQHFYAIGPLINADSKKTLVSKSLLPEFDCSSWLNGKSDSSVLYISFGSLAKTDKQVVLEIANGLLPSEINFIWVLRKGLVDLDDNRLLPDGFENSVKDRGLIVPWCDQNQVLSSPAIGGFLTHCGWNSILESIWFGVPMICYPLFTDQITNRKLVVDDWKVGLNVCDGEFINREEVKGKIECLMDGKRSYDMREEVKKVRKRMQNALAKDGSSEENFDCFVDDLRAEMSRKCDKI